MLLSKKDKIAFQKVFNIAVDMESASKHLLKIQGKVEVNKVYSENKQQVCLFFYFSYNQFGFVIGKGKPNTSKWPFDQKDKEETTQSQTETEKKKRERGRNRESKKKRKW